MHGQGRRPNDGDARGSLPASFAVCVLTILILSVIGPARAGSVYLAGVGLGGGAVSIPVESFQKQKYTATIAQEHDFSCGSAALATLLTYNYKLPVSEDVVFKSMFQNGDQRVISKSGFSLLDMKKYLDRRGIPSGGFRAPLSKLVQVRLPAIVLINIRGYRHFVVLEGLRDGRVLLSDPANGARAEPVGVFEKEWTGVFFLILADVEQAQNSFNGDKRWASAPLAPLDLARFAVDLDRIAQPGLLDLSRF